MPFKDGWYQEGEVMWPGQAFSLKVKDVLFEGKSDFQDVKVFQSTDYGKVLVLDDVIQLTERDEHAYQEMITNIPMMAHPNPTSVLIVGGGDGGVLREVCRHSCVQSVTMCEIDALVVDVSKRFLGDITATSFDDPRVNLVHQDAAEYIKSHQEEFDVVIVDSSDPVGPAETLFKPAFYDALKDSLRPGGIICNQGECMWLHLELISQVLGECARSFPVVDYAFTTIPTYPSGQIGFLLCSLDKNCNLRQLARPLDPALAQKLRYYSPDVHTASFVLPTFAEKVVSTVRKPTLTPKGPCASVAKPEAPAQLPPPNRAFLGGMAMGCLLAILATGALRKQQ